MIRTTLYTLLLSLVLSSSVSANNLMDTLDQLREEHIAALELSLSYPDKGRQAHSKVASSMETLSGEETIDQGVLAYNIGNSWFHAGRYGKSILWYRRAESLGFVDPQLQQNLDYVRSKRLDNLPDVFAPVWLGILYELSGFAGWLLICALGYLMFWWRLWRLVKMGQPEREKFVIAAGCLVLVMGSLSFRFLYQPPDSDGVILTQEIEARKGPGLIYSPAFTSPLNAGTEIVLLQEQQNWLEIELSDGQVAWLPQSSVTSIE